MKIALNYTRTDEHEELAVSAEGGQEPPSVEELILMHACVTAWLEELIRDTEGKDGVWRFRRIVALALLSATDEERSALGLVPLSASGHLCPVCAMAMTARIKQGWLN